MREHLVIGFTVSLERYELDCFSRQAGPLFHRWLPDGEPDAIRLDLGGNRVLKLWFQRTGFLHDSIIEFDYDRREVDPNVVARQAVLEAGPLFGSFQLEVAKDEMEAVRNNRLGDPAYVNLGKLMVQEIVEPHVFRFLRILRVTFGQYWIRIPEKWDSRYTSLGHYCHSVGMRWRSKESAP